jgi:tetratricopeptide (TPR) repeat protein
MLKSPIFRIASITLIVALSVYFIYKGYLSSTLVKVPISEISHESSNLDLDSVVNLVLMSEIGNAGFDIVDDFPVKLPLNIETDSLYKLSERSDSLRMPALSGFYFFQLAERVGIDTMYFHSGRYFFAASETQNQTHFSSALLRKAISCFDKVLELDPDNDDAVVLKVAAMLQDNQPPMQSIGILLAYEERFPDNEKVLYMLAELSAESQQWDKAEKRIKKLISLHPSKPDYYFMMSEVFTRQSMKDSAKHYLDLGISFAGEKTF